MYVVSSFVAAVEGSAEGGVGSASSAPLFRRGGVTGVDKTLLLLRWTNMLASKRLRAAEVLDVGAGEVGVVEVACPPASGLLW